MKVVSGEAVVINYYPNDKKENAIYDVVLIEQNLLLNIQMNNGNSILRIVENINNDIINDFRECYSYFGSWFYGKMIDKYCEERPVIKSDYVYGDLLSLVELGEGISISYKYNRHYTLSICDDKYVLVKVD